MMHPCFWHTNPVDYTGGWTIACENVVTFRPLPTQLINNIGTIIVNQQSAVDNRDSVSLASSYSPGFKNIG